MSVIRRSIAFFLLVSYSLVLLHNVLPHFHIDDHGQRLEATFWLTAAHDADHHHHHGMESELVEVLHEIFSGLHHAAGDHHHLMHYVNSIEGKLENKTLNLSQAEVSFPGLAIIKRSEADYSVLSHLQSFKEPYLRCCSLRAPPRIS